MFSDIMWWYISLNIYLCYEIIHDLTAVTARTWPSKLLYLILVHSLQQNSPNNSVLPRILPLGSHSNLCIFSCGHWFCFSKCIYYVKYHTMDCELYKFKNGVPISLAHLTVLSTIGAESLNKQWAEPPWAPFSYWKRRAFSTVVPSQAPGPDLHLSHGHSPQSYLAFSVWVSCQQSYPQQSTAAELCCRGNRMSGWLPAILQASGWLEMRGLNS